MSSRADLTRSKAFTLVELLLVVGIIALLIGILLPALSRAREMARRAKCLSNNRQLSAAWLMYANDNKGRICWAMDRPLYYLGNEQPFGIGKAPWWLSGPPYNNTEYPIVTKGRIWPYLRNKDVYLCPDDPQEVVVNEMLATIPGRSQYSYALNMLLGESAISDGQLVEASPQTNAMGVIVTMGQIRNSERMLMFCETGDKNGFYWAGAVLPVYTRARGLVGVRQFSDFHRSGSGRPEGCTVSFVDGHAIFWSYTGDIYRQDMWFGARTPGTDMYQLAAWNGVGEIPPGVTP